MKPWLGWVQNLFFLAPYWLVSPPCQATSDQILCFQKEIVPYSSCQTGPPTSLSHACVLSHLSRIRLCVTPRTVAHQVPLFMGFPRQEYWCGLPFPPPGDLPNLGIEPTSLKSPALAIGFFTISTTREALAFPVTFYSSFSWCKLDRLMQKELTSGLFSQTMVGINDESPLYSVKVNLRADII